MRPHHRTRVRLRTAVLAAALFALASTPLGQPSATHAQSTEVIALTGNAAPDGNGRFSGFPFAPALNDAGHAVFRARLIGTADGFNDTNGVFRGDGSAITQIARDGQTTPDANATFSSLDGPSLNHAGQVAFSALLKATAEGSSIKTGIFRTDGNERIQIAREGQATPDAEKKFSSFNAPVLNNAGQTAFSASLTATAKGSNDDAGIFRSDGTTLTQIARKGQAVPDGNGVFSSFNDPDLNHAGQAAFSASVSGAADAGDQYTGIFRGDGTALTQIARAGQAAPDGNGAFASFYDPDLNHAGQVAFVAHLTDTAGNATDDLGLYLFDDALGLIQIVRKGDPFLGSTLTDLRFNDMDTGLGQGSGLNNRGQAAFHFSLADRRAGIAVYTNREQHNP